MSQQHNTAEPVALIHAAWLDKSLTIGAQEAAAELRRLHTVEKQCDELAEAVEVTEERLRMALVGEECKQKTIIKLTSQRDELLAALEHVVSAWSSQFERYGHMAPEWAKHARAAIASVKGGA